MRGHHLAIDEFLFPLGSIPACAGAPRLVVRVRLWTRVYPRVCGGTYFDHLTGGEFNGLSPRVRGHLVSVVSGVTTTGSIPACAGAPHVHGGGGSGGGVYPRVCGGTVGSRLATTEYGGLSPRVRGHRRRVRRPVRWRGSIPACAGAPPKWTNRWPAKRVYPRVCGGTHRFGGIVVEGDGLSPRVRGHHLAIDEFLFPLGSIPACAGAPLVAALRTQGYQVYPRVCGGTCDTLRSWPGATGLSPRVRGHLNDRNNPATFHRSIPACAGAPYGYLTATILMTVYPRVCGGTTYVSTGPGRSYGLSPRVRGHLGPLCPSRFLTRSIPACAGAPGGLRLAMGRDRVYPRVCGGTSTVSAAAAPKVGLSPRVRGHQLRGFDGDTGARSIPACAGAPDGSKRDVLGAVVYPRVCGGTTVGSLTNGTEYGLSPRVRGHQHLFRQRRQPAGSIPACAGAPIRKTLSRVSTTVYPRVCGGHPGRDIVQQCLCGSIPACAGAPRSQTKRCRLRRVYPRVCGGTPISPSSGLSLPGLSPRVRGHPGHDVHYNHQSRSIPACAGAPW